MKKRRTLEEIEHDRDEALRTMCTSRENYPHSCNEYNEASAQLRELNYERDRIVNRYRCQQRRQQTLATLQGETK